MRWSKTPDSPVDPSEALHGPWTPENRPHLRAVIDQLATPAVQDVLARLAAMQPGKCWMAIETCDQTTRARDLLLARARYRHAGLNDIAAAIDDLETLMRLAATCSDSRNGRSLLCSRGLAFVLQEEIRRIAFERHLTWPEAARLIAAIRSILPNSHAMWQRELDVQSDFNRAFLDHSFTLDHDGNGWLVLSRMDIMMNDPLSYRPRCGLWNCLSPLFNDRRTVAAKIDRLHQLLADADKLSFPAALAEIRRLEQRSSPFSILDGPPFYWWFRDGYLQARQLLTMAIADRRATVVALALSAYRGEHAEYPASLEALLGEYVDATPLDPFSDRPLRYFRKPGEDDYVLYSVGTNLVDDGGLEGSRFGMWADDILVDHQRSNWLDREVVLEEVDP
jgi:hypothetical protein